MERLIKTFITEEPPRGGIMTRCDAGDHWVPTWKRSADEVVHDLTVWARGFRGLRTWLAPFTYREDRGRYSAPVVVALLPFVRFDDEADVRARLALFRPRPAGVVETVIALAAYWVLAEPLVVLRDPGNVARLSALMVRLQRRLARVQVTAERYLLPLPGSSVAVQGRRVVDEAIIGKVELNSTWLAPVTLTVNEDVEPVTFDALEKEVDDGVPVGARV